MFTPGLQPIEPSSMSLPLTVCANPKCFQTLPHALGWRMGATSPPIENHCFKATLAILVVGRDLSGVSAECLCAGWSDLECYPVLCELWKLFSLSLHGHPLPGLLESYVCGVLAQVVYMHNFTWHLKCPTSRTGSAWRWRMGWQKISAKLYLLKMKKGHAIERLKRGGDLVFSAAPRTWTWVWIPAQTLISRGVLISVLNIYLNSESELPDE